MKRMMLAAVAAAAMLSSSMAAALPSTFAQFLQKNANDTVRFINDANTGPGGVNKNATLSSAVRVGTTGNYVNGSPIVSFGYLDGPDFLSLQDAYFSLSATTTLAATADGTQLNQYMTSGTMSFTRLTAAPVGTGNGARTNLLTINFNNALITGTAGGSVASFSASTLGGATVTMTSDFFNFDSTLDRDFSLSFSSVTSVLARVNNDNLRAFRADATGTFSSDPAPIYVPEPSVVALFGFGLLILGFARRRRRS